MALHYHPELPFCACFLPSLGLVNPARAGLLMTTTDRKSFSDSGADWFSFTIHMQM